MDFCRQFRLFLMFWTNEWYFTLPLIFVLLKYHGLMGANCQSFCLSLPYLVIDQISPERYLTMDMMRMIKHIGGAILRIYQGGQRPFVDSVQAIKNHNYIQALHYLQIQGVCYLSVNVSFGPLVQYAQKSFQIDNNCQELRPFNQYHNNYSLKLLASKPAMQRSPQSKKPQTARRGQELGFS